MNSLIVFNLCLMAIGLCTLNFCCGYWLSESQRKKRRRSAPRLDAPSVDRAAYQEALNTLLEQVFQVCKLPSNGSASDVTEAISKLGKAANAMERATASYDFPVNELRVLTTQPDGVPMEADGDVCNQRRPYPTWQYLAPYSDALPDPSEFRDVFCHDISVGGISYLLPEAPTATHHYITVGSSPDWLMLEAQVANYRRVQYKGLPMYLVGCRFSRRLGSFSELWPNKQPFFGQPVSIHPLPHMDRPSAPFSQSA